MQIYTFKLLVQSAECRVLSNLHYVFLGIIELNLNKQKQSTVHCAPSTNHKEQYFFNNPFKQN